MTVFARSPLEESSQPLQEAGLSGARADQRRVLRFILLGASRLITSETFILLRATIILASEKSPCREPSRRWRGVVLQYPATADPLPMHSFLVRISPSTAQAISSLPTAKLTRLERSPRLVSSPQRLVVGTRTTPVTAAQPSTLGCLPELYA